MQNLLFFLTLLPMSVVLGDKLSWCDYWYRRGIARSECQKPRQPHWSLGTKQTDIHKQITLFSMPICDMVSDWSRCQRRSPHCPLGLLCWVNGSPCCTPQATNTAISNMVSSSDQCPSPQAMGIRCNAKNTVNWCQTDRDCHRSSSLQRCCDSGCGYNLCVRISMPVDMNARLSSLSVVPSQCPSMDAMSIGCSRKHGTSWCNLDKDCYQNGAQTRSCCPTRCGYNVCLLRLDANKWIIA